MSSAARIVGVLLALTFASSGLCSCGGGSTRGEEQTTTAERPSHYEGGEESVERYGAEAEGASRKAILAVEHGYLNAIAAEDFEGACTYLAASVRSSLEELAGPKLRTARCKGILPNVLARSAPATAREQARGRVTRTRVKGKDAFVVFHAPGARLFVFALRKEGGGWRATALGASVLAPSANGLGAG